MVIDFQHHYIPVQLAKKRGLYSETGRTMLEEGGLPATTMHRRLYDLDLQLDDMAQAGIDVSVLSCLLGWSAPLEDCRFINDDLAAIQKKYPHRFVGLAQAPILEGKTALDELRRAIGDLGLHGVTITSQVGGFSLDSPKLYDFYEMVCALDVPVFVHPALVPTGYEHLKDYDLPRVLGREVDLTVAITRLIAGGIFDRVPDLKIVMAHFGGGIAAVKDRLIGKGYRFGTLQRPFGEYYDKVYFDMAGFEGGIAALNCALQGIRPERMVFASDYPQDFTGVNTDTGKGMKELKNYIEAIRNLPLDDKSIKKILGDTAAELLKLC
ncbi:MAG TPA: amidohydrolase family protein [Candidatus Binatia bacterium]|jgi:predicted TIM-barrel fold metal-dependent hydrolase|nr:amidohydrolase family protein [Candidatus Binatia bacterium]